MTDLLLAEITAAVIAGRDGHTATARQRLIEFWDRTPAAESAYRCVAAHYLADLFDHPAQALIWDTRALDATRDLTDADVARMIPGTTVAVFRPSLHLNIADQLRRLGAFEAAAEHVTEARGDVSALPADQYGSWIRGLLGEVHAAVTARDSAPLGSPSDHR